MTRWLLLLLLVAVPVRAQQAFAPSYPSGEAPATIATPLQMACGRYVATSSGEITNATKLAANVTTGFGGGAKVGFAIYPDLDAGTAILSAGNLAGQPAQVVSATGLTAGSTTAGNTYRACFCATTNAGAYQGPNWSGSAGFSALQNIFKVSVGHATNPCAANAVPPATTGALIADASQRPPELLLSVE